MVEPISAVAEIGIRDVEIGQVRFRLAAALRAVLDFKFQIRPGQPCDEWGGVAGAAAIALVRKAGCKDGFAFDVSGRSKINLFYRDGRYAYEIQNGPEIFGGVFAATPSYTK